MLANNQTAIRSRRRRRSRKRLLLLGEIFREKTFLNYLDKVFESLVGMPINYGAWQNGDTNHHFDQWLQNRLKSMKSVSDPELQLARKYFDQWKENTPKLRKSPDESPESFWLPRLLFCRWSQPARKQVCSGWFLN